MTTVILSNASPEHPSLEALTDLVRLELARRGETDVCTFDVAAMKLAYCLGDFDCWVKTPGVCRCHDVEQDILRAVHDADRLVLVDAVTFGGHSSMLKRAQDRMIPLLLPFFGTRNELTHHPARYDRPASLYALGWQAQPDIAEATTWCELADANAVNMRAPRVGVTVVDDLDRAAWPVRVAAMLASSAAPGHAITDRRALHEALETAMLPELPGLRDVPRSVALLVGSAKPKGTSTSENLARALAHRLERAGIASELHFATEFVHDRRAATTAASATAACDAFAIVSPLYVDALPALVTRALERVASERTTAPHQARLIALINCGFPEPEHTRIALRIARHFAARAGYHWSGGLALGGGGAVSPKSPIDEQHGPVAHILRALDEAAASLSRGEDLSAAAREAMMKAPMPDFVYRAIGDAGWRLGARRNGLPQRALRARPLDPKPSGP
jgi:multimeric flavodoxin WrbA